VLLLLCACAVSLPAAAARGELKPSECVVLYTKQDPASRRVAEHYAAARSIPADHLIGLDLLVRANIPYESFQRDVVRPLRGILSSAEWGSSIRCLVTGYNMPLRVASSKPTAAQRERAAALSQLRARVLNEIDAAHYEMASAMIGGKTPTRAAPRLRADAEQVQINEAPLLIQEFDDLATRLFAEGSSFYTSNDPHFRERALNFVRWGRGLTGWANLLHSAKGNLAAGAQERLEALDETVRKLEEELVAIQSRSPLGADRARCYELTRMLYGALALAMRLDTDVRTLRGEEDDAAFDSELALLWCDEYSRFRWQPNALSLGFQPDPINPPPKPVESRPGVIMVARLDGATPEMVTRLIDDAIATENEGLTGKFYLDARGLTQQTEYAVYDQFLIELAEQVRTKTDVPVVLDRREELFQPGECPAAALNCGWYSAGVYVPAFTIVRGAVGVHIASFELRSVKADGNTYWCPNMMRDGVAATFGPVGEPYLHTFPDPRYFFGLLLTGKHTLAECFWLANPYTSWKMALVGDPLYRPFMKNPKLKEEDVLPRKSG
jgi:uncharacterized protein (TIGR03790 family)